MTFTLTDAELRTVLAGTNDLDEIIAGARIAYHDEKRKIDEIIHHP